MIIKKKNLKRVAFLQKWIRKYSLNKIPLFSIPVFG